jgi:hypothetical protein
LAAYATANMLLSMQLNQMRLYRLRPLDLIVFHLVAVASVQRSIRDVRKLDRHTVDIHPTDVLNGTISRRRIAESTGIARATVSRSLGRLIQRGMVVERGRGRLQVPVGIALQGEFTIDPNELYAPVLTLIGQFMRLGIVRPSPGSTAPANNNTLKHGGWQ